MKLNWILATSTLAALLGCSASEGELRHYSQINSEQMLRAGFSDIQQIYIDKPEVAKLAIAGLKGLRRIEPQLSVEREDNIVKLRWNGGVAGVARAPTRDDAFAWAIAVSRLLHEGRRVSTRLGKARTEEIYTAVFDGLAKELDAYSRYSSAEEATDNRASRDGFGGIGVTIVPHTDGVEITDVINGLPAERAGLRKGDRIVSVDGRPIDSWELRRIARLLQGRVGEPVSLDVRRKNNTATIRLSVARTHITPQTVFYRREGEVAVVEISSFNAETTASVMQSVYRAKRKRGIPLRGIVLDLRDNPGGLLHQAVRIADLFLEKGRIISTHGRHRDSIQVFDATSGDIADGLPIAVLVNGQSASAAEILAAALQDHGRAVVIGATTFGKGTVQTVLRLPNDGELILTWARLHAPSGYGISGVGVVPTICTQGGGDAQTIVRRALREQRATWRRMISIRRSYETAAKADRKRLAAFCRPAASHRGHTDLEVARTLLAMHNRYRETIKLIHAVNGL